MGRPIPLWFLIICLLLFSLFTIIFGWAAQGTRAGSDKSGLFGEVALEIATFPTKTKEVFVELRSLANGNYKDRTASVLREEGVDYSDFAAMPTAPGVNVQGIFMQANRAKMAPGWRLLAGAFTIDEELQNAALLISPDLQIVRTWALNEIAVGGVEPRPWYRKYVHGVDILDDGSLIFAFDGGTSLQRVDACGERRWAISGLFNHAVTLDDKGQTVWTFSEHDVIAQVDAETGEVLRQITMDEIIAQNPTIDILGVRRAQSNDPKGNSRNTKGVWLDDPYHLNDVDPLPAAIADKFDGFDEGDLLVSARSLNLIFVLDPNTSKVKWWRSGFSMRQHDPDWLPNGEISVLNNRMSMDYSEIVSINPATFERTMLVDGREHGFYTRIRGKQQQLGDGSFSVTSSQQGRAFEVDRDGKIVFEVVNLKPNSDTTNYVISEMKWLPLDGFSERIKECTINN
jgi:hypothetical protein